MIEKQARNMQRVKWKILLGLFVLTMNALAYADVQRIRLVALDRHDRALPGMRFSYQGIESHDTTGTGATDLLLPPQTQAGQQIKLVLHASEEPKKWFLVNAQINIPAPGHAVELKLMRRSEFRNLAAEVQSAAGRSLDPTFDRQQLLDELAAEYGLTPEQFTAAIQAFGETDNEQDQGIAAYLAGEYADAEVHLEKAVENQQDDLVESLRYLGASYYEQGKYEKAAKNLSKALVLAEDDTDLLNGLGLSYFHLAKWGGAESLMRQALVIDEASFGSDHPKIATDLNNLAQVLQHTNRLDEAESLMRRALAIDKEFYGSEHPKMARHLSNLASLFQDTGRYEESEPLVRRALVINEVSYGPNHPKVATDLNNLAQVLQDTNRLDEAESLMRRALTIDKKFYGSKHPKVAIRLSNLASLLMVMNRLDEAAPMMRRALVIDEASYGPDHPEVALGLNNLAQLLKVTNRLDEAEPLMRRALAIDEASYGPAHPKVARQLNNLALLLHAKNRLSEAVPLMRRGLLILIAFQKATSFQHPNYKVMLTNYMGLLTALGRSEKEVDEVIRSLVNETAG